MESIYEIVQGSVALEGSTLTMAECERLLSKGISSEGKTIAEQLLCLNLRSAYEKCFHMANSHEYWSVYRLRSLGILALRDSGVKAEEIVNEKILQKVCDIANVRRLHINSDPAAEQYQASFEIHYLISQGKPWLAGNDYMARLLMNYLQYECRLTPTIIRPSQRSEYKRILGIAKSEEISVILVSYMMEHCCDPAEAEIIPEKKAVRVKEKAPVLEEEPVIVQKILRKKLTSREQIQKLLRTDPYMSTKDLAQAIGISPKGVEKQLGNLKAEGRLRRIGPDKGGKWEVI